MIDPYQIGDDEDLAREILVIARSIAPCIRYLADDSEDQRDAVAILRRVYAECVNRGPRSIRSQRIGPASVEYLDVRSAFDGDPRTGLRALCAPDTSPRSPVGSFPEGRPLMNLWPEGGYS